ncbi:MAG: ABC transporter substrate-binding protein [Elainellaceae cyanobacterium]
MAQVKRRQIFLGLVGFGMSLIVASCTTSAPPDTGADAGAETSTEASADAGAEASAEGAMPETIRIGHQVIPNAETLAKAMGLADEAFPDTEVEYISFASGRDVNTAMAGQSVDMALLGSVGVGVGIAQKLPYEVFFIHDVIGEAEALAVKDGISEIADLSGTKLAVPFGSTTHFVLLSLMDMEGLGSQDVTVLDLQPQDMVAAWQRGDIDGGYVWYPHLQRMLDEGGSVLITSADMSDRGVITADVGIVSEDFMAEYPDAVQQYIAMLDEAINFYREDPEAAAETIAPELGLTPEESLQAMEKLIWLTSEEQAAPEYLGTPDQPGEFAQVLKDSADFMVTQDTIQSAPELKAYQEILNPEVLK